MSGVTSAREVADEPIMVDGTTDRVDGARLEIAVESAAPVEEAVVSALPNTAGGRLRAAREAAGLSLADVAEVLRFSAHQIDALERDDHASLAGSTLVRGMIRGYAKLLKIKSEPLLIGLGGEMVVPMPEVRAPTNIGLADKATTVARISRGAVVLLAFVVLLFAAVTGYVYLMSDIPPPAASAVQTAPSESTITPAASVASPPVPLVATDASISAAPAQETAAISLPKAEALVIDFDDLSWIEVTDATQSIVFRGEQPKGTHQVIEGKPPFQLWIGRASVVRVNFADRVVDLKPYTRENIARLTVE